MNKKPFIGVTPSFDIQSNRFYLNIKYTKAIQEAGGIPLIIPYTDFKNEIKTLLEKFDGFLLTGGGDVHPLYYREEPKKTRGVVPERDILEIEIVKACFLNKKPVFAICRGSQVMNVAMGGNLIQHINSEIEHEQSASHSKLTHTIIIEKETLLYDIFKKREIRVNSFHHQAVNKLGKDLKISARAKDGIVEAIESDKHPFFLGVQFHPEHLFEENKIFLKLFKKFIDSCK